MTLNLNSEWNTNSVLGADRTISDCYVSFSNSNTRYNVTPEWVESFYVTKERMEREAKEAELRKIQVQNMRLRAMVKQVIFSGDRTIIMWNDGTKTVTQCHELDVYDKEKGILACMAKKLYENTNLFNEVIQEYVDFEEVTPRTIVNPDAVKLMEMLDTLKEYKHYTKRLEEDLDNEILNREEMETMYYSLQNERDAYAKQCDEYIKDIDTLTERIKDMEESLEYKDYWIDSLQSEIYWLEEERNELQEELDNCKCHTAQ
jgi:hypothetical protein